MYADERTNVLAAWELLLEQLEQEARHIDNDGGDAFKRGDHAQAQKLLAQAAELKDLRAQVQALEPRLRRLVRVNVPIKSILQPKHKANEGSITAAHTPEAAYRLPILRVLEGMGGAGRTSEVLRIVGEKMRGRLYPADFESLPSGKRNIRWSVTASWCRNTLKEEGLLKADSPNGVWEISDTGRDWLKGQEDESGE